MQALRKTVSVGVRMGQRRMAGNMGVHKNRAVEVRPTFPVASVSRSVFCCFSVCLLRAPAFVVFAARLVPPMASEYGRPPPAFP